MSSTADLWHQFLPVAVMPGHSNTIKGGKRERGKGGGGGATGAKSICGWSIMFLNLTYLD